MVMIGPRIGAGTEQHSAGHCWSHPEARLGYICALLCTELWVLGMSVECELLKYFFGRPKPHVVLDVPTKSPFTCTEMPL